MTKNLLAGFVFIAKKIGEYAQKNGHDLIVWSILGFFFSLIALLSLHIGIVAKRNGHKFKRWATLGFFLGISALLALQTGLIAERKGYDFPSFCLLGVFLGIITLLVVCFLPLPQVELASYNETQKRQQKNSKLLESGRVANTKYPIKTHTLWICKCGQENVSAAKRCINCFEEKPE